MFGSLTITFTAALYQTSRKQTGFGRKTAMPTESKMVGVARYYHADLSKVKIQFMNPFKEVVL